MSSKNNRHRQIALTETHTVQCRDECAATADGFDFIILKNFNVEFLQGGVCFMVQLQIVLLMGHILRKSFGVRGLRNNECF